MCMKLKQSVNDLHTMNALFYCSGDAYEMEDEEEEEVGDVSESVVVEGQSCDDDSSEDEEEAADLDSKQVRYHNSK